MKTRLSMVCLAVLVSGTRTPAEVHRWIRFDDAGVMRYGLVADDQVRVIEGAPWNDPRPTGRTISLQEVRVAVPTDPKIVLAAAYNFRSHLGEREAPTEPQFFWKTPQCLIADRQRIELPVGAGNAHYEAELVIVMGRTTRNATIEEAANAIFGYTCGNDISERTWQKTDVQWWRAKASRTFGPVGPVVVSGADWQSLRIQGLHNGRLVQDESASDMLFSPPELVQYASRFVTLRPGDLIFTASPGKTEALKPGDIYEVRIEPIGRLRNGVSAEDPN